MLHITNAIIRYHLIFVHDPRADFAESQKPGCSVHTQMLGIKSGAQLDQNPFPLMAPLLWHAKFVR